MICYFVDTRRCFDVNTTSCDIVRRRIEVETMSCVRGSNGLILMLLLVAMFTRIQNFENNGTTQKIKFSIKDFLSKPSRHTTSFQRLFVMC